MQRQRIESGFAGRSVAKWTIVGVGLGRREFQASFTSKEVLHKNGAVADGVYSAIAVDEGLISAI